MHQPNIVLIGPMGAGKTTIGKALAAKLSKPHIDIDTIIEQNIGLSISNLFAQHGEAYFRNCEHAVLLSLQRNNNLVISCGGGIVMLPQNQRLLTNLGKIFYLAVPPPEQATRISASNSNDRPLLLTKHHENISSNLTARLNRFFQQRRSRYLQLADIIIPAALFTIEQTLTYITEHYKLLCAQ